jgi:hypothetical protein
MSSKRANALVVILLVAVGISLLAAAVSHVRAAANRQETADRMRILGQAMLSCNDAHGRLPPAYDAFADIRYPASLHVHLLRYLEEDALYQSYLHKGKGGSDASFAGFQSPSDPSLGTGAGVQNYAANLRVFSDAGLASYGGQFAPVPLAAAMPGSARIPGTFTNGTSNTICFATKFAACGQASSVAGVVIQGGSRYDANPTSPFAAFFGENVAEKPAHPSDPDAAFQLAPRGGDYLVWPLMAQSFSRQGIAIALGDGSVRDISPAVSPDIWNRALQPNACYYGGCDW